MTKNKHPLISVIVRSMDRSSLPRTIESINTQEYNNIEILLVNAKGGVHSPQNNIQKRFPIHILNNNGNPLGRSEAGNIGLRNINGEYFSFLDDDDTIDQEHFAHLIKLFTETHNKTKIFYSGIRATDGNDPNMEQLGQFSETFEKGKLLSGNFMPIHAPLVPTRLLNKSTQFDESLKLYEDWDFWLQLSEQAEYEYSGKVTGTYTINGTSGANPIIATDDTIRKSTLILYSKWIKRIKPIDIFDMTRLYHSRNIALHQKCAEIEEIRKTALDAKHENDLMRNEINTLKNENEAVSIKLSPMSEQLRELQNNLHFANLDRLDKQQLIDAILSSRSWKITSPLRTMTEVFHKALKFTKDNVKMTPNPLFTAWIFIKSIKQIITHNNGFLLTIKKGISIYNIEGYQGIARRLQFNSNSRRNKPQINQDSFYTSTTLSEEAMPATPIDGIAVMAHVYYADLFDEMLTFLRNIPWNYSLCISTTTEENRKIILEKALNLKNAMNLDIRITPNRGRDIAPLLVEFREKLTTQKFVLHIHTKKSSYSGRERIEWRNYLLASLLGSRSRVNQIFTIFNQDKNIGIIYPETFTEVPYWAHTWLKNKGHAIDLCTRMGIDISNTNYIDAPMGSMFWARVDALRPLLNLNLSYKDFPDETGQADGTMQHAIERLFVLSANSAGYRHQLISPNLDKSTTFYSPGLKNLDDYFTQTNYQRIVNSGSDAKIISFDIFDTLLVRHWFTPENLHSYLSVLVKKNFGIDDFIAVRKNAESIARRESKQGDVDIFAIYNHIGNIIGNPLFAQKIRKLEEDLESASLTPNIEICNAANALRMQGKKLILISDMYLTKEFINNILTENNIGPFHETYISSETGFRKDRGDAWSELPTVLNTTKDQWLHIGDNEQSDVQNPIDLGFRSPVHVMRSGDLFYLFNEDCKEWFSPEDWQEGLYLGLISNRIFLNGRSTKSINLDPTKKTIKINSLKDFGYLIFGPTLCSFMAWLFSRAKIDNKNFLLYASREGHLLMQAHELISQYIPTPTGKYFLCSRRATILSSLVDQSSFDLLLNAHFKGTFREFLELRLGIDDFDYFYSKFGDAILDKLFELPRDFSDLQDLLHSAHEKLLTDSKHERDNYVKYIQQMTGGEETCLVDIGYAGTIQKSLHKFMPNLSGGYYFATTSKISDITNAGYSAMGCFGDKIDPFNTSIPIYKYALLSEAILTAPHGQFLRFSHSAIGSPNPIFKKSSTAQENFDDINEIHIGALEFLKNVLNIIGQNFTDLSGHNQTANLAIKQAMKQRWLLNIDSPALRVEDNYSGNGEIPIFNFYKDQEDLKKYR